MAELIGGTRVQRGARIVHHWTRPSIGLAAKTLLAGLTRTIIAAGSAASNEKESGPRLQAT